MSKPHADFGGPAGAGKSKMHEMFLKKYGSRVHVIPKITCRNRRKSEHDSKELIHATVPEFRRRRDRGEIIVSSIIPVKDTIPRVTGALRPEFLRQPKADAKIIISAFAEVSPLMRDLYPDMFSVYFDIKNEEEHRWRLFQRCEEDGTDCESKWATVKAYKKMELWRAYDKVIWNDGTPEDTFAQVEAAIAERFPEYDIESEKNFLSRLRRFTQWPWFTT